MFNKSMLLGVFATLQVFSSQAAELTYNDLNVGAQSCYKEVFANDSIYPLTKPNKGDEAMERLVIKSCTYSDAEGFAKCYEQAGAQADVLAATKNGSMSNRLFEEMKGELCRNSYAKGINKETGDIDAIDCVKAVMADPEVLVATKDGSTAQADVERAEKLAVQMCTSSNGKGATTCYKKVLNEETLKMIKNGYAGKVSIDKRIVELCKATRIR